MPNELAKISEFQTFLATIENLHDARRMMSIAQGLVTTAKKEYIASERATEVREDRDRAYDTAVKSGELRLMAEAKLGELLKASEKPQPRSDGGQFARDDNGVNAVDYGLSERDQRDSKQIFKHKDLIPEVVAAAIRNNDIPTRKQMENLIHSKERLTPKPRIELPEGIFDVIYADPPWKYDNSGFTMSANQHYDVMELTEIQSLPIKNHTAENGILFLWATNPMLLDAFAVIEAWGFNYKTNMVWAKDHATAGFYVRGQHELLLICTKGSRLPSGDLPISIIRGENKIHSKKPDVVYNIIETMYPDSSYCELFARNTREGWTSWGNQIDNTD